ncbi:MAG TPA: MOSC domain-containing protein [Gaiellaceae bacterium]|nr:MOSC domain-containing protein [Gaiellaceae bacterium]
MPSVARLSVTPVKSLALHHPEGIMLERFGVAENRRFYLVREDGRLLAGVHHGPLVEVRAGWDEAAGRLRLAFPDGSVVEDEVRLGEPLHTDFWGHRVAGRVVRGPWAGRLSDFAGRPVRLVKADAPGGGVDVEPVTLVSLESVEELARRAGRAAVDGRRFRMLVDVRGCTPHEEDSWAGRAVRLGEALLEITGPVPRCATTTRDPSTGRRDFDALRAIAAYRGRRDGKKVDFGVYGRVLEPGRVVVGDRVEPVG